MDVFLRILKEVGISIVALILVGLVIFFLFHSQLPFLEEDIPAPVSYAGIDNKKFDIVGDIEDEINPTQTYKSTNEFLQQYMLKGYVSTGTPNPFTSNGSQPDVPSERVTSAPSQEDSMQSASSTQNGVEGNAEKTNNG